LVPTVVSASPLPRVDHVTIPHPIVGPCELPHRTPSFATPCDGRWLANSVPAPSLRGASMNRSARTRLALTITAAAALATTGTLAVATMASAHNGHDVVPVANTTPEAGDATFLVASLEGRNEVPGTGGPVNDRDGQAFEVLRIKGNQVSFAMKWRGIAAPTAGHVHAGAAGVNGGVKIGFFASGLPDSVSAAVGSVT